VLDKSVGKERRLVVEYLAFCELSEIKCVDARSYLVAALEEGLTVYPRTWDDHPLSSGYAAYAEPAYEKLVKQ
jgi:hypothetical protein